MEKIKKTIIAYQKATKAWLRENRLEVVVLLTFLLVGAFFRLYKIDEYMTFLGDEGRDAIVVRRLIVELDPILIGPRTSIGDMYLGPLYYYMMAPALALSLLSPVGPAVMIALLGVATIFFVWWAGREWFGRIAGMFAAGLYAVSPVVITHARHSWNPNIMPFFALLAIYAAWKVWQKSRWRWLVVAGISMAFVLQSHYLGLLLLPTIGFFWLLTFKDIRGKKQKTKKFLSHSLYSLIIFLLLMSPLVIFDSRHGWRNFAAMRKFFTERQTTVSARPWTAIPKLPELAPFITARLVTGKNETVGFWTSVSLFVGTVLAAVSILKSSLLKRKKLDKRKASYLLLLVWIGAALVGLGVYKQHIYDHYYGFFFPAPFILLGGFAQGLANKSKVSAVFVSFSFIVLLIANLAENPLKYTPNRQMQRTMQVAEKISKEANEERFNLAVIAERNYEDAYQYFLEKEREPVVDIDPLRADETITGQLFVICELPKEECDPTHDPKAEIANFGWSRVEGEWEVAGVILYKLVHTQ